MTLNKPPAWRLICFWYYALMVSSVRSYSLYAITIFLSAFLLFLIQPIAGKLLLPWFGGSSSVWATSMLFFTGMLFAGYCYSYWLTRLPTRLQTRIHISAAVAGATAALISLLIWRGVFPPLDWTIGSDFPPAILTLLALIFGLGVPYFLLATTGPLLQFWYGVSAQKEPYKLYAISNTGSLLALASYPFLIEPAALLAEQEMVWTLLFLVFAYLLVRISSHVNHASPPVQEGRESIPYGRKVLWILYAALPAFMLLATTTEITQTIAPLPLLWIVPLSVYLLSFIIAFAGYRGSFLVPLLLFCSAYGAWRYIETTTYGILWRIIFDVCVLFFLAWHAHAHLYRLRPSAAQSALFYVHVAFGGMLGTLLASIVPPLIFSDYYEFAFGLTLAAGAALHIVPAPWPFSKKSTLLLIIRYVLIGFILTLIAFGLYDFLKDRNEQYAHVSRNFYGNVKVYSSDTYRSLLHGTTLHGMQVTDPGLEFVPLAYYSPESGIGRAFMYSRLKGESASVSVGILGLGAGMTAAFCTPGDEFVYYEIDPRIEEIAREYFTYLDKCPQAEIRLGDGRILLDQEFRNGEIGKYDLVLADAFNDDTIPVHLITREAIHRYVSHLKDERSIVAVHISNRYLDLLPVLMAIAQEDGLSLLNVQVVSGTQHYSSASHWVLLSPSSETFNAEIFAGAASPLSEKRARAWTDSYSNLLSAIDFR